MKQFYLLFVFILLSSCMLFVPRNLTDNAFYKIEDCSVRMIIKHDNDTLYKTEYEKRYNLPGNYFKLLSTTNEFDTTLQLGIQLKLWAQIVLNEKGNFYGEFAKNGLLEKIENITIQFVNGNKQFDVIPYLSGDSSLSEIKWRQHEIKKTPYTWGQCIYFKDLAAWKNKLNNHAQDLKALTQHDYVFLMDKKVFQELPFKPELLKISITLVDSTGALHRQLVDSTIIN
jgi:hypothetical protein